MNTLSERMNMKFGEKSGAHTIKSVKGGMDAYDTLCLICAELGISTMSVSEFDFTSASIALDDFAGSANDESGYTISVWFD